MPIHQKLRQYDLRDLLLDYDATSLYPSAMWDDISIYSTIETRVAFTVDMNYEIVENINGGKFNQVSAILEVRYYNPPEILFQHVLTTKRVQTIEVNGMRNASNIDTLRSVDKKNYMK